MNIIQQHKTEAANLALEHYDLIRRKEQIEARMRELNVILKTAEHAEAEKQQALKTLREELTAKPDSE